MPSRWAGWTPSGSGPVEARCYPTLKFLRGSKATKHCAAESQHHSIMAQEEDRASTTSLTLLSLEIEMGAHRAWLEGQLRATVQVNGITECCAKRGLARKSITDIEKIINNPELEDSKPRVQVKASNQLESSVYFLSNQLANKKTITVFRTCKDTLHLMQV